VLFCEAIISAIFFVFFFSFHYLSTLSHTALGGVKQHWSWRYMFLGVINLYLPSILPSFLVLFERLFNCITIFKDKKPAWL